MKLKYMLIGYLGDFIADMHAAIQKKSRLLFHKNQLIQ